MGSIRADLSPQELIRRKLLIVYKDDEVQVYTAPNDDQLRSIIVELLDAFGPMSLKSIHEHLSGLVSEDRLKYVISRMEREGIIVAEKGGAYRVRK